MIRVDPRKGSKELLTLLNAYGHSKRVKAQLVANMGSGDFAFTGNGPHGDVSVGIERKTLYDLINSIRSGRLMGSGKEPGQAIRMMEDYKYSWLIAEGIWRGNPNTGLLERGVPGGWKPIRINSSNIMQTEVDNFLVSLSVMSPLRVVRTDTIHDTALFLINLYKWWSKPWDAHKSGKVFRVDAPPLASLERPSLVRRMVKEVKGVGWEKTKEVDVYFKTPIDMVCATAAQWAKLTGIDKVLAARLVKAMTTGKED